MLGYAFMANAHSNAYRKLAYMTWPPPLLPPRRPVGTGYERWTTDWRDVVADADAAELERRRPIARAATAYNRAS